MFNDLQVSVFSVLLKRRLICDDRESASPITMVPPNNFIYPSYRPIGATILFDQCAGCSLNMDKSFFCVDKGASYLRRPMIDALGVGRWLPPSRKYVRWHGRKLLSYPVSARMVLLINYIP